MTISPVVACKSGDPPPPLLFVHHPFLLFTPFSHPPESSCEFPSEEQVIALPPLPSPPTSLLSPSPSCFALSLSLSPSLPLQSIPLCPDHLPLAHCFPFFSLVQWLYERSAVWSQARLVEEVKAEVGTLSLSLSFLLFFLSLSLPLIFREWQGSTQIFKYCTLDCLI